MLNSPPGSTATASESRRHGAPEQETRRSRGLALPRATRSQSEAEFRNTRALGLYRRVELNAQNRPPSEPRRRATLPCFGLISRARLQTHASRRTELINFAEATSGFVFLRHHFVKESAEIVQGILIKSKWSVHTEVHGDLMLITLNGMH